MNSRRFRFPHRLAVIGAGAGLCLLAPPVSTAQQVPASPLDVTAAPGVRIQKSVRTFRDLRHQRAIRQRYDYSCGAAALAILLHHYYRLPVSEESIVNFIIQKRGTAEALRRYREKKGFSLLDLKHAATSVGFHCLAYREMTLADLVALQAPAIVPIRTRGYDHFVVFRGCHDDRVYLADPIVGNITMKASNFVAAWRDGVGMILQSTRGLPAQDWEPGATVQGYVSQDMVRRLAAARGPTFVGRGAGEF